MKRLKSILTVYTFIFSVIIFIGFNGCKENETVNKENNKSTVKVDKQSLQGSWVRTDADYQIKLSDVQDNGIIKAQYLPERDMLVGDYFQAVERVTYYVEFTRDN